MLVYAVIFTVGETDEKENLWNYLNSGLGTYGPLFYLSAKLCVFNL